MSRGAAVARGSYTRNLAFLLIALVAFATAIGVLAASPKKALAAGGYWGYICIYNGPTSYTQQWVNDNNIFTGNPENRSLKPWLNGSQPNNLATPQLIAEIQAYLDANGPHVQILDTYYTDPATSEALTWTYNHDCMYPGATPTPTPSYEATPTPTPTLDPCGPGGISSPCPTATPNPCAVGGISSPCPTATPVLVSEDTPPPLTGLDTESTPPPTDLVSESSGGSNLGLGLALLVLAGIMAAAGLLLPKTARR